MTCSTCGVDNPAHLTFCQECGQRLGPRIAPPTPPIGLSGQEAYGAPPEPHAAYGARATPPRGATALGIMGAPGGAPPVGPAPFPPAAAVPPAALGATAERRCKVCETLNGPNLRYCTSCGSTLEPTPARPAGGSPFPEPPQASAPARGVDLGAPAEAHRTCARCRGVADAAAQFCKFCGYALPEARGPAPAPPRAAEAGSNGARVEAPPAGRGPTAPIAVVPAPQPLDPMRAPQPVEAKVAAAPTPSRTPAPARGRLVVIAKSGVDGPSYPFGDLLDIGRAEGNVVVAEDPYLAPRHARLTWTQGKLVLRDLASTNGVYLRLAASRDMTGRRASEGAEVAVPLASQDLILVGQQVLRFEILTEAEGGLGPAEEHGTLLFGSPAAPRYARLCQRTVEGITRDVYHIRKAETVLGRESGDVVFTEDPFLSRRHAAIRLLSRDGATASARPSGGELRFALVDLGSSNGTFLRIRGDAELVPGDHFRVGQQLFRVDFDGVGR